MILVADSGSTKTNWLSSDKQWFETIGFNPFFHNSEKIVEEILTNSNLSTLSNQIQTIYFYGAGCSSSDRNQIVHGGLKKIFPTAQIFIDHDLKAAAFATFNEQKGIACILGTGSNSCLFDGENIEEAVPALGYILGDEGSGSYFGKRLLSDFLYHQLPANTTKILHENYGLTKEKIFAAVYNEPNANVYLASFSKVLSESTDTAYIEEIVQAGFEHFFKNHVCCYPNYQNYPVHFVGSIAFHFKHLLQNVATKFHCQLGNIDKQPVFKILDWHLAKIATRV